jgi:anti-sigma B factor antagonist
MEVTERREGDVTILMLSGSLDSNTSSVLEDRIMARVQEGDQRLILDFGRLDYISSAGLRVLNKATKKLGPGGGRIILCSMQDYIREVFEIAGFDYILPIVPSLEEALAKV